MLWKHISVCQDRVTGLAADEIGKQSLCEGRTCCHKGNWSLLLILVGFVDQLLDLSLVAILLFSSVGRAGLVASESKLVRMALRTKQSDAIFLCGSKIKIK